MKNWIPCEEQLPEIGIEVAIRGDGVVLDFGKLKHDGSFEAVGWRKLRCKVTHWMKAEDAAKAFGHLFFKKTATRHSTPATSNGVRS